MPFRLLNVAHEHADRYVVVDEHDRRIGPAYDTPLEAAKVCAGMNAAEAASVAAVKAEFADPEDDDHPPFVDDAPAPKKRSRRTKESSDVEA